MQAWTAKCLNRFTCGKKFLAFFQLPVLSGYIFRFSVHERCPSVSSEGWPN